MTADQYGALGILAVFALWLIWADQRRPSWVVAGLMVVVGLVLLWLAVFIALGGTIAP